MKIQELFKFKKDPESILSWEGYDLFKSEIEFEWDIFFDITSEFKISFSNRDGINYLGIGHLRTFEQKSNQKTTKIDSSEIDAKIARETLTKDEFFKAFESLPSDIFYFYQQTFYKDKTSIILPEIQIIHTKEKTLLYYFQKSGTELDLQTFKDMPGRNILMQESHEPDEHGFRDIFKKTRMFLLKNPKVVLSRKTQFRFKNRVPIQKLFLNLFKEGFYNYFIQTRFHYFVGSSPERLLKFSQNTFFSEALAGTKPIELKNELLNSTKDLDEQKIVLDEILASIKSLAGSVTTSDTYLYEYKNLAHLKTDITAKPQTTNIFSWIDAIHPTPAVCGLPRTKAFDFLKNNEPYKRENYCSSLGIIQRNHMDIAVAIRCAEVYRNLVIAYVGAGVVKDSNLELEWQELDLKLENMRRALEI